MSEVQTTETQAPSDQAPIETKEPTVPDGFVSVEVYERMKKDLLKQKADSDKNKKALEDAKLQRLKETQNWEAVAKQKEQEATEEKQRRERLESSLVQHQKYMALKSEALKHNMYSSSLDDLELLDLPEVSVETTESGKILVHGAERAIVNLKTLRPHWFQQKTPAINPQSPETILVQPSKVTLSDLSKLEDEYKKNPSDKTKQAYFEAIKKFKTS